MLLDLGGSTRPDIEYAMYQYACFSHAPKWSHEVGIKHIVRHLKGTRDKGLVMRPNTTNLHINLFADAEFSGLFTSEYKHEPISVKSRTGILLNFDEVPILQSSKLQLEIALSILKAEYIALSHGMTELVAAKGLLQELSQRMNFILDGMESNVTYTWEDNIGTQNLTNSKGPLMSPLTKHIGVKYHWFCSKLSPKELATKRLETKKLREDLFTKGLTKFDVERLRKLIMG